ncbi:MAG: hypothetical protein LBJ01_08115 [Tannerella sp.]|nr:hypothetical protein [Tannerella sp.]
MKHLIFILVALLPLSCKTPGKTVSGSKLNRETVIDNDMLLTYDRSVEELTGRIVKRLFDEQLNIDIRNVRYDTEKPVDSITGKHPVSEETGIRINRKTGAGETDSIWRKTDDIFTVKTSDNSRMAVKVQTESKEERKTGLEGWQKALMAAGIIAIIGFVVFITVKIRK